MSPLRALIVLEDGFDFGLIREAFPAGGQVRVATLGEAAQRGVALFDDGASDLVVVGCMQSSEDALRLIAAATARQPDCPIVVLYPGSPNGFMEATFEAGVALAVAGNRSAVIDLDLQFGDVGLALGLKPEHTIYDLAVSGGALDGEKIESFMARHESGTSVLLAPVRPDQAGAIGISFLRDVYAAIRSRYDFVILDTPPAFSPEVIGGIDSSSHLCIVGMLDALSIKATKIGLETLARMGHNPADATLVLNRADSNVGIAPADVEELLGRRPDILVPSDRAIPRALTDGRPIVLADPKSGAARAFTALAERYIHERAAATVGDSLKTEPSGRGGLRGALLRKAS